MNQLIRKETVSEIYFRSLREDQYTLNSFTQNTQKNEVPVINVVSGITLHVKLQLAFFVMVTNILMSGDHFILLGRL